MHQTVGAHLGTAFAPFVAFVDPERVQRGGGWRDKNRRMILDDQNGNSFQKYLFL